MAVRDKNDQHQQKHETEESQQQRPGEREIARVIEAAYPELRGLLLTAVEQLEAGDEGKNSFLQHRVLQQAVEHCQETGNWRAAVPSLRGRWQDAGQLAALAGLLHLVADAQPGVVAAVAVRAAGFCDPT